MDDFTLTRRKPSGTFVFKLKTLASMTGKGARFDTPANL
jgi:hypothetical protein